MRSRNKATSAVLSRPVIIVWLTSILICGSATATPYLLQDLEARGISPLPNQALTALVVGARWHVRNERQGTSFEITFYPGGIRLLRSLSNDAVEGGLGNTQVVDGVAPYVIGNTHILTTVGQNSFRISLYKVDGTYVAHRSGDPPIADWTLVQRKTIGDGTATEAGLEKLGLQPLKDAQLHMLISGRSILIHRRSTNELFVVGFHANGTRSIENVTLRRVRQDLNTSKRPVLGSNAKWAIRNGQLVTSVGDSTFAARIYAIDGDLIAVRDIDAGKVDWELLYLD